MIRAPGSSERPDLPLAVVMGSGGLGKAVARRLGADHRLLIASRNAEKLDQLCQQLRAEGHDARYFACDMTDPGQVRALAEAAGEWRTLAHVSALSPGMGDWDTLLGVNWLGTLHVEQNFHRTAYAGSAAIFVSSLGAHSPPPAQPVLDLFDEHVSPRMMKKLADLVPERNSVNAYTLSKFAMNRMCRRRAAAWGQKGARILSLSPGLIDTPMGALEFKTGEYGKMALYAKTPIQREGTQIEVAATLAFLASDAASFITGTDLLVDGGLSAALAFPS